MAKNPKTITIYGRLSWPVWNHAEAVARNAKGMYPTTADKVAPEFNLCVTQDMLDKLTNHLLNEFLPYCEEQFKAGERNSALEPAPAAKLRKLIEAGDWDDQPPYIPIKTVPEKTAPLTPESVAMVKIKGVAGQDMVLKAIVRSEDELLVPDPDKLFTDPVILPIQQTTHQMYPGAVVTATLNLYAYMSGKVPGISASASVAVFKAENERFGGGVAVDEDEMFLDA